MPASESRAENAQTNTIRRRHPKSWSYFPYFRKEDIVRRNGPGLNPTTSYLGRTSQTMLSSAMIRAPSKRRFTERRGANTVTRIGTRSSSCSHPTRCPGVRRPSRGVSWFRCSALELRYHAPASKISCATAASTRSILCASSARNTPLTKTKQARAKAEHWIRVAPTPRPRFGTAASLAWNLHCRSHPRLNRRRCADDQCPRSHCPNIARQNRSIKRFT